MDIQQLKKYAIKSIENAIHAHEKGDIFSIEDGFDEYDRSLPRDSLENDSILYITLEFWASWADSAIHDWQFYPAMTQNDWPRLAKILLEDLRSDREITNVELLENFKFKPPKEKKSFFNRFTKKLKRK